MNKNASIKQADIIMAEAKVAAIQNALAYRDHGTSEFCLMKRPVYELE